MNDTIAVLGAGSWGTALAIHLARNNNKVRLWGHNPLKIQHYKSQNQNTDYLPDIDFPNRLTLYSDLETCLESTQDILINAPSHAFRELLIKIKQIKHNDIRIAWGTKGIDPQNNQLLSNVLADIFSEQLPACVLSGPSFAKEVATQVPTAISIAGNNKQFLNDMVKRFHSDCFRIYINDDLVGVQLCGVMKNVLAIATGIADGLNMGSNAKAALITRGIAEMTRLCDAMDAQANTIMSLAGIGDVILTCTDNQSRNRRFGLYLGQGKTIGQATQEIGQAIEGMKNVTQLKQLSDKHSVDMPITAEVYNLLQNQTTTTKMLQNLMGRKPRTEK